MVASQTILNKELCRSSLLRFYQITDEKDDDDDALVRYIIRFDKTPAGQRLKQAFMLLDSSDVLARSVKATIRQDRCPKGGLIRNIENVLENYLGKKGSGKKGGRR